MNLPAHMQRFSLLLLITFGLASCRDVRIKEHKEWGALLEQTKVTDGCLIIKDQNHESVHYYNLKGCSARQQLGETIFILSSVIALEKAIAVNDDYTLGGDSTATDTALRHPVNLRTALATSNHSFYMQLNAHIGANTFRKYIDTIKYGNREPGNDMSSIDLAPLKITADEQLGFIKRLYFSELPCTDRSQRIVKTMLLKSRDTSISLYYQSAYVKDSATGKTRFAIVGISEFTQRGKEKAESLNKSDERSYPYFFSGNWIFDDQQLSKSDMENRSVALVNAVLKQYGAYDRR
ncbi:MAG: hypothetical protein EBZ77_04920 [Chitinophagia bacterium]|nr:hypothetical protein [Chitinophagia bacterium]